MAIANTPTNEGILTQKLATVMALEVAKNAGFLKNGSKDYFSNQINGQMKAGREYTFIIPDAGNVVLDNLKATPKGIEESEVKLSLSMANNSVEYDALEAITEIGNFEEEVANRWATALIQNVIKKEVKKAALEASAAFIGKGFVPMAEASAHLMSVTDEKLVGWIDPSLQAVMATNGQQFMPCGSPNDLYAKGKLGTFQNVEYTAERFLNSIRVSEDVIEALTGATATFASGKLTVTLSKSATVPAGTPIMIDGVKVCDVLGMETDTDYAFIVREDVTGTSIVFDLDKLQIRYEDNGGRMVSGLEDLEDAPVYSFTEAGTYGRAYIRGANAYNFSTCKDLDIRLSDKGSVGAVDGIRVSQNAFTDGEYAKNMCRWDFIYCAGTVWPQNVVVAYVKKG